MEEPTTVETQVNESPETTVNNEQGSVAGEPTLADLHADESTPEAKDKKKVDSVPMARLNKEIQRRKDLEAELKELRGELSTDPEVEDVDDEPEVKKLAERLESIEKKERSAKMEVIFQTNLAKTLENAPEYKEVVNTEVIKQMAFNPANANKTYKQLLEEAYGNALTGRRTIETTLPRGGAKDTKVDMRRTQTDKEYRHAVLADPELRKQYNEGLTDRVFR